MMEAIERKDPNYNLQNDKFNLNKVVKNYVNQFNQLYNVRLTKARELIKAQVKKSWGNEIKILDKIIDSEIIIEESLSSDLEYVIIGTIYKQMDSRNSVLDEFKDSNTLSVGPSSRSSENYSSESDYILLEDESGRITLSGTITNITHDIVTGVVVAVRGIEKSLGSFESSDWLFLNGKDEINFNNDDSVREFQIECLKKSTYESPERVLDGDPLFVMIVSDLQICGSSSESDLNISRQMLFDFICGRLGSKFDKDMASRICRLVVAGNSLSVSSESPSKDSKFSKQHLSVETTESLKCFDLLLSQSLGSVYIDVMPGSTDPSNLSLPQQPLHSCLFPLGRRFNSLNLVTNPHSFDIDGCTIVGHSGQPVSDILRQTRSYRGGISHSVVDECELTQHSALDSINTLRKTYIWGHFAPTAPDTLACHPFTVDDPFIVEPNQLPKIVFSGCQKYFATRIEIVNGQTTRLLSIPSFNLTKQAVLVDIKTLNYQVMSF